MPALHEIQRSFLKAVLQGPDAQPGHWPPGRLAVYRVNARENFVAALQAAFPLLLGVMGERDFRAMARAYQRAHPSRSGNLFWIGEQLPGFLAARLTGTPDAPLTDIARFEWQVQEALVAAEPTTRVDLGTLASLPPTIQASLHCHLHPAARLIAAHVDVFALWRDHHAGRDAAPGPLITRAEEQCLLISRAGDGIVLERLPRRAYRLLEALAAGDSLAVALQRIATGDATDTVDPGRWLYHWIDRGVITAIAPVACKSTEASA